MAPETLRTIARDAQINHWPSHLGLTTDAERIHQLALWLESLADEIIERDSCDNCSPCDNHGGDVD